MLPSPSRGSQFSSTRALPARQAVDQLLELRPGFLDGLAGTGELEEHVAARALRDGAEKREPRLRRPWPAGHAGAVGPLAGGARHPDALPGFDPPRRPPR